MSRNFKNFDGLSPVSHEDCESLAALLGGEPGLFVPFDESSADGSGASRPLEERSPFFDSLGFATSIDIVRTWRNGSK